jgi:hypothetical protein
MLEQNVRIFGSYRGILKENLFLDEAPTLTFMGDKDSLTLHLGHFPSCTCKISSGDLNSSP